MLGDLSHHEDVGDRDFLTSTFLKWFLTFKFLKDYFISQSAGF